MPVGEAPESSLIALITLARLQLCLRKRRLGGQIQSPWTVAAETINYSPTVWALKDEALPVERERERRGQMGCLE